MESENKRGIFFLFVIYKKKRETTNKTKNVNTSRKQEEKIIKINILQKLHSTPRRKIKVFSIIIAQL